MTRLSLVGEGKKEAGQRSVESHNEAWIQWIRKVAKSRSVIYGQVTVDDLREVADENFDYPTHHNAWGCVFREKGWVRLRYEKSKRPAAHARPIGVWQWRPND